MKIARKPRVVRVLSTSIFGFSVIAWLSFAQPTQNTKPSAIHNGDFEAKATKEAPNEHDVFVGFTTVAIDASGHTLAWKLLKSWPIEDETKPR